MRFSARSHANGLLRWNPETVQIVIGNDSGSHSVTPEGWLGPGEAYRFLDRPLGTESAITLEYDQPWPEDQAVAWYERSLPEGLLGTDLWVVEKNNSRLIRLSYVPDCGVYHRFVVDAGRLRWDEDLTVRHGRDTIRFIDGKLWGPWSDGVRRESGTSYRDYRVTLGLMEGSMEGRFLEIVASGENAAEARTRAQALLGHISLILGPASYGSIVIDAEIDARWGHSQSYVLHSSHRLGFEVSVDSHALDVGLSELETLAGLGGKSRAMVALERYAQGTAADAEELRFAAFVSGIDAVVSSFYRERGGGAMGKSRRNAAAEFELEHLQRVDMNTIGRIRNLLISPSFLDRFTFYVEENGLDRRLINRFSSVRSQRDDLFHAGRAEELGASAMNAKEILEAIICSETGIDRRKIWRLDRHHKSIGTIELPGMGWSHKP